MNLSDRTNPMSFSGSRLEQRRKLFNLNQDQLASITGASQSQISRYERGSDSPSTEVLIALAGALDTTTDYLLELTDQPGRPIWHIDELTEDETMLLSAYRAKAPDQRKQALRVLQAL